MIQVSGLCKNFGPVRALDRVSFEVAEGEILGFLGPNGAGKSTTMRILTGFLPGDRGTVRVAGHDVRAESLAVRRQTGYLPEGVPIYPEMRVIEYLRFRARLKGVRRDDRRRYIGEVLDQAGISDMRRRVIGTLSRGYRQRVGLADALLGRPRVLILDEPTVGLDPEQVRQFRQLLGEVGRDRTVILSTHILSEVELVCSSVVIIQRGRVVARDTAENLRRRAGRSQRVRLEADAPRRQVVDELTALPGVEAVEVEPRGEADAESAFRAYRIDGLGREDLRPRVFELAKERGWVLRELTQEELPLEDAFVALTRQFQRASEAAPKRGKP